MARAPWQRYPEFVPARLLERLAECATAGRPTASWSGNGSNELIQATLAVTVEPGDAVVAPAPTFSLYRLLTACSAGGTCRCRSDADFQYDVDALIEVAVRERARVVVLNSPNNPTGSALPDGRRRAGARGDRRAGAVRRGLPGFRRPDAHCRCWPTSRPGGGAADLLQGAGHGGAPLRRGAGASRRWRARSPRRKLPYNVNLFTLAAAEVALRARRTCARTWCRASSRHATGPSPRLSAAAGHHGLPERGQLLPDPLPRGGRPSEVFRRLLEEHGILVRDVSAAPGLDAVPADLGRHGRTTWRRW